MKENKLNIGLLINKINNPYQNSLYKEILKLINEFDHNLTVFSCDKILSNKNDINKYNSIYELPNFDKIDGLIISINDLNNTLDYKKLNNFIGPHNKIPMVCVSHKAENITSIIIDNKKGIKELINHLIHDHSYKNFVFIKGPSSNFDANERYNIFIEILNNNNIIINKDLILNGDFSFNSGYSAVEDLLSKKIDFDVIISANDLMAIGAIEALNKNGILVPYNKAIVGFDDMDIRWFSMLPITSVKQPICKQARKTVSLLIDKIFNKKTPELIKIPTSLNIKESCGCLLDKKSEKEIKEKQIDELAESINKLRKSMISFIQTLSHTIEARDPYTAGHQKRVSNIARCIAQHLNLSQDQIESIRMAALIHDLGKIFVPADILNKPGKLKNNEFNLIKDHPKLGYDILKDIEFPWPIANIILQHHEKINGTGYPKGLYKNEIMIEAKILCVADVVEAISSHRPYRPSLGLNEAILEIKNNSGKTYDPEAVNACIELYNNNKIQ